MKKIIPGTPILALIYNMPTILVINTEEKLHRFFFNVINWPKIAERIMRLHLEKY
jgi:hypothetical protein